ncbi:hypothetical protein E4K72_10510 [Oxalobacteraceae bacterium OM1]|nr:hypothetical protein E4K72_10510 [Oxalobacteraceae bacterium OM1]
MTLFYPIYPISSTAGPSPCPNDSDVVPWYVRVPHKLPAAPRASMQDDLPFEFSEPGSAGQDSDDEEAD